MMIKAVIFDVGGVLLRTEDLAGRQKWEARFGMKDWELAEGTRLRKTIACKDFLGAVGLIQRIAVVAEAEDHHPDLHLTGYRRLTIELSTHAIGGLSENDFILAAKIDQLLV